MAALMNYSSHTGILLHINAGSCSDLVTADTTCYYDLSVLTPRMKTMLLNVFKRGYMTSTGNGKLGLLSTILPTIHKVPRPILVDAFRLQLQGVTEENIPTQFELTAKMLGLDINFLDTKYACYAHISLDEFAETAEGRKMIRILLTTFYATDMGKRHRAVYDDIMLSVQHDETVALKQHIYNTPSYYGSVVEQR